MNPNRTKQSSLLHGLAAALLTATVGSVQADVAPGTVIDAANLDSMKGQTFEGHKIGDMIYEKLEWQIRNKGLKIYLKNSQKVPLDPEYTKWDAINAQSVKYDPSTRSVSGWKAGIPFPMSTIDVNDPTCGDKIMWNVFYASPIGTDMNVPQFAYLLIDGDKGLERAQKWEFHRVWHKGRWGDPNGTEMGDQEIFHKTLIFAKEPFDIKGLGLFTIKYDSPKLEDNWAYIRSFRRVRRLSGGAWMDPIGGTDQLNDDIEIFNAHPTWYPQYKCLGKQYILATNNGRKVRWVEDAKTDQEKYPAVDLQNAPYWNPIDDWEPAEVIVVEGITPPEHPYSKKVMYYATEYARIFHGETYDQKGEFWKFMNFLLGPEPGGDGKTTVWSRQGHIIDFQRNHATVFLSHPSWVFRYGLKSEDVTLGVLEAASGS